MKFVLSELSCVSVIPIINLTATRATYNKDGKNGILYSHEIYEGSYTPILLVLHMQ